jgi:hypothetical protein
MKLNPMQNSSSHLVIKCIGGILRICVILHLPLYGRLNDVFQSIKLNKQLFWVTLLN